MLAHSLRDPRTLPVGHLQAGLCSAPQHVFGSARPFVLDEVAEFALREAAAEIFAEVRRFLGFAEDIRGLCAVPPEQCAHERARNPRVARRQCRASSLAPMSTEVASLER